MDPDKEIPLPFTLTNLAYVAGLFIDGLIIYARERRERERLMLERFNLLTDDEKKAMG